MDWLFKIAKEYGLFVTLVCYVLWDSRGREARYISIIDELSQQIGKKLVIVEKDISEIKKRLIGGARRGDQ